MRFFKGPLGFKFLQLAGLWETKYAILLAVMWFYFPLLLLVLVAPSVSSAESSTELSIDPQKTTQQPSWSSFDPMLRDQLWFEVRGFDIKRAGVNEKDTSPYESSYDFIVMNSLLQYTIDAYPISIAPLSSNPSANSYKIGFIDIHVDMRGMSSGVQARDYWLLSSLFRVSLYQDLAFKINPKNLYIKAHEKKIISKEPVSISYGGDIQNKECRVEIDLKKKKEKEWLVIHMAGEFDVFYPEDEKKKIALSQSSPTMSPPQQLPFQLHIISTHDLPHTDTIRGGDKIKK